MSLASAVESVMADFYRPLFDEYGIYAIDSGFGQRRGGTDGIRKLIEEYAAENSDGVTMNTCRISTQVALTDGEGEEFISQAVEAQEAVMVEGAVETLLKKFDLIGEQSETAKVLERKTELESRLAVIDTYTVELMRLIDGVSIDVSGMIKGGTPVGISDSFVKRFFVKTVSMADAGINNADIFTRLSSLYENPCRQAEELATVASEYADSMERRDALYEELATVRHEIGLVQDDIAKIQKASEVGEDSDINQKADAAGLKDAYEVQLRKMEEQLETLESAATNLESEYEMSSIDTARLAQDCTERASHLSHLCGTAVLRANEARNVINAVTKLQESLRSEVAEFESLLNLLEEIIDKDTFAGLSESLTNMKGYVGLEYTGVVPDYVLIDETLEYDERLISKSGAFDVLARVPSLAGEVRRWAERSAALADGFSDFSYEGLYFDYSVMPADSVNDELVGLARDGILEALSNGFLKLVLPANGEISKAILDTGLLPELAKTEDEIADPQSLAESIDVSGGESVLTSAAGGSAISQFGELLKGGAEEVYEKSILALYLRNHFDSYAKANTSGEHVLKYEQEYLLCGNPEDETNLAGALTQILLIRLASAGIYTMTNRNMTEKAKLAANATVGFLGLPFLTILVRILILTVWALEQALVETAAIACGKRVSLITTESDFCIQFHEIVTFSPETVKEKAESFTEGSVYFSYEDYLTLLTLIKSEKKLAGRAMNLIQENLRYKYDEDFLICNCVVRITADAEFASEKYLYKITRQAAY